MAPIAKQKVIMPTTPLQERGMVKETLLPASWIFGSNSLDGNDEVDELDIDGHSYLLDFS